MRTDFLSWNPTGRDADRNRREIEVGVILPWKPKFIAVVGDIEWSFQFDSHFRIQPTIPVDDQGDVCENYRACEKAEEKTAIHPAEAIDVRIRFCASF